MKLSKRLICTMLSVVFVVVSSIYVFASDTINVYDTTINDTVIYTTNSENENEQLSSEIVDEIQPMMARGCSLPVNSIILGWTVHGTRSAYTHDGHGVSDAAILQAVTTTPVWNQENKSFNYYGDDAVVCLNTSGHVTTCWPTTSNGYRYP